MPRSASGVRSSATSRTDALTDVAPGQPGLVESTKFPALMTGAVGLVTSTPTSDGVTTQRSRGYGAEHASATGPINRLNTLANMIEHFMMTASCNGYVQRMCRRR